MCGCVRVLCGRSHCAVIVVVNVDVGAAAADCTPACYGTAWRGLAWYGLAWHSKTLQGIERFGTERCCTECFDVFAVASWNSRDIPCSPHLHLSGRVKDANCFLHTS